jgi:hypothetical protein
MNIVNNSLTMREQQQKEIFNQLEAALKEKLTEFAARLQAHIDALVGAGRILTPPARSPPSQAARPSGSAPPPSPPSRAPPSAASASYHHFSHHSFSKPSRKNKGKASAARSGDLNPENESSSNNSDDSVSSSSDSDLSDAFFDFMRHRRRITTSSPRLLFGYRIAIAVIRESKANSSSHFRMKRGEDYRSYVEGCECYMDLQVSRFLTEKHRII